MPARRHTLVLRRTGAVRLLAPTLLARIPDGIAATAIVILIRSEIGSYSTAGLVAAAFGIGTAVSAPLAGRALDRLGQRRVLLALALVFAAALTGLALDGAQGGTATATALAAAAGLSRPPVEAALRTLWPRLVPANLLDAAYSLDSTMQELIWIAGPLLMTAMLATGDRRLPLVVCAALSVAGTAAYVLGLRALSEARASRATEHVSGSLLHCKRLRLLMLCGGCYGVSAGMLNLGLVTFAGAHGGIAWTGVLVAIWGVGSLVGGLAYGSREWKGRVEARAMTCLALFGATLTLLAAAPNLIVLAVLMLCLGIPLSPWLGTLNSAVQRAVPPSRSTEAFAWSFAVITVGLATGNALGGALVQRAGTAVAFSGAGALSLAGAGLGLLRLWRRTTVSTREEARRPRSLKEAP